MRYRAAPLFRGEKCISCRKLVSAHTRKELDAHLDQMVAFLGWRKTAGMSDNEIKRDEIIRSRKK